MVNSTWNLDHLFAETVVGVALQAFEYNNVVSSTGVGNWSIYTSNSTNIVICQGDTGVSSEVVFYLPNSGVWQIAYDSDTGEAWFGLDGQFYDSDFNETTVGTNPTWGNIDAEVFARARVDSYEGGQPLPANFGQKPFLYQPDGWEGIQTQNLLEAPIQNGRDHFQAITGQGDADGVVWQEATITQANPTDPLNLTTELGPWTSNSLYNQSNTFLHSCFTLKHRTH